MTRQVYARLFNSICGYCYRNISVHGDGNTSGDGYWGKYTCCGNVLNDVDCGKVVVMCCGNVDCVGHTICPYVTLDGQISPNT